MSKLEVADFPTTSPMSTARLAQRIEAKSHFQGAAADAAGTALFQAEFDGQIGDAYAVVGTIPGAGESMTFDILKNGSSIMTGGTPVTMDATTSAISKKLDLWAGIDPAKRNFVIGDVITITRDYTAGGTPTPMVNTTVVLEPVPSGLGASRAQ